jgi:hypothetical protein
MMRIDHQSNGRERQDMSKNKTYTHHSQKKITKNVVGCVVEVSWIIKQTGVVERCCDVWIVDKTE